MVEQQLYYRFAPHSTPTHYNSPTPPTQPKLSPALTIRKHLLVLALFTFLQRQIRHATSPPSTSDRPATRLRSPREGATVSGKCKSSTWATVTFDRGHQRCRERYGICTGEDGAGNGPKVSDGNQCERVGTKCSTLYVPRFRAPLTTRPAGSGNSAICYTSP